MENKDYYEWLEISRNASPEVIEKAYKALVKKYHPDLQEDEAKIEAEDIMKHITEAYSVLSDNIKKAEYDATLQDESISKEDYDKLKQELNNMKNTQATNYIQPNNEQTSTLSKEEINQKLYEEQLKRQEAELQYRQQVERARQQAYHDAYIQDLKNRGYKIRYKKTFKDYLVLFITIIVLIVICIVLWQIPFIRNWLINLYNSNEIIKFIVGIFANIINSFRI